MIRAVISLLLMTMVVPADAASWRYQGQLHEFGRPAEGEYDVRLKLLDARTRTPVTEPLTLYRVSVRAGRFDVPVDFGFDLGRVDALLVETEVRQGDTAFVAVGAPVPFSVKTALGGLCWALDGNAGTDANLDFIGTVDAEPLVLRARNSPAMRFEPADTLISGRPSTMNVIAGTASNDVENGVGGATIAGGGAEDNNPFDPARNQRVLANFGTIGGGRGNLVGAISPIGLDTTGAFGVIGGGDGNFAVGNFGAIGGGEGNLAGASDRSVPATGSHMTVGGGQSNRAFDAYTTVAGGRNNAAGGSNSIVPVAVHAGTVGGGSGNRASNLFATVGGGTENTANGEAATVSGGRLNCAGGAFSWAGGQRARVRPGTNADLGLGCSGINSSGDADGHEGTFVWADAQPASFISSAPNQFLVRAQNGMAINVNTADGNALRVGGTLQVDALGTAGSANLCRNAAGQIAGCSSSARYKRDIVDLDHGLDAVLALRAVGYRWRDTDSADVGFVAEEVAEVDERLITRKADGSVEGVKYDRLTALLAAAVQELSAREQAQARAIAALRSELDSLRASQGAAVAPAAGPTPGD